MVKIFQSGRKGVQEFMFMVLCKGVLQTQSSAERVRQSNRAGKRSGITGVRIQ